MKAKLITALISMAIVSAGIYGVVNKPSENIMKDTHKKAEVAAKNGNKEKDEVATKDENKFVENVAANSNKYYVKNDINENNNSVSNEEVNIENSNESGSTESDNGENNDYIPDSNKPNIDDNKPNIDDNKPNTGGNSGTEDNTGSEDNTGAEEDVDGEDNINEPIDIVKVDNVISSIELLNKTLTYDDKEVLEKTVNEYSALTENEKALVTNYSVLESAKEQMESIQERINFVYDMIHNIPDDLTDENYQVVKDAVQAAEAAYKSLPEESKKGIDKYSYQVITSTKEAVKRYEDALNNNQNPDVINVENLINALPVLKFEDIEDYKVSGNYDKITKDYIQIKEAVDKYHSLSPELQNAVDNYDKLHDAVEKITYLRAKAIEHEISKINLKTVSENDRPRLEALREAYYKLNTIGRNLVTNYGHLLKALNKIDTAASVDKEKVNNVINSIQALNKTLTYDDKEALENAEKEYSALTENEKALVTNYSVLENAKEQMISIQERIDFVYDMIHNIPDEVTDQNYQVVKDAVQAAEAAYNSLPEESKKGIDKYSYQVITSTKEAVKRYEDALNNSQNPQVKDIENLINGLPVLKFEDIEKYKASGDYSQITIDYQQIKSVLDKYVALSPELQHAVKNYDKLQDAVEKITYLRAKAIEHEISKINIKTVSESDRPTLVALRQAYYNLNTIGRNLVTNYGHLLNALSKLDSAK